MPSGGQMQALCDGSSDDFLYLLRLEQHLVVVEAQHGVAAKAQPGICFDVASAIRCIAVMRESVELDHEPIADENVDRVAIDPDLLPDDDTDRAHEIDEVRLESGIRQMRRHVGQTPCCRAAPQDALQHVPVDQPLVECRLPIASASAGCWHRATW